MYEDAASVPVAHADISQDRAARAEQHVLADLRVPVPVVLARAAQRHAVQQRAALADYCCFPDHHARRVVNNPVSYTHLTLPTKRIV